MIAGRIALGSALLLLAGCTHRPGPPAATPAASASARPNEWRVATHGALSTLVIADQMVSFCDEAGFHQLQAQTGQAIAVSGLCPANTPTSSHPEVTVRTPELGPDDIVELQGEAMSFPIQGHARDWATDAGKVIIVGTASEVLEIIPANDQRVRLSESGAARVAVGGGWVAWWDDAAVTAHRL